MLLYPLTVLASAFLLFQVQPILAKILLPWFGGTAAVWSTCLLFFQSVLLLGYAYAHALTRYLSPKAQGITHSVLLLVSLASLPVFPGARWRPTGGEDPVLGILAVLAATVGAPYLMLSTTSPLLQAWHAREKGGGGILSYRLYALSNAGSLLALLSYPFLIEPLFGSRLQALGWSAGYGLFAVIGIFAALRASGHASPAAPEAAVPGGSLRPPVPAIVLWLALPMCASVLLLATTGHLSQNIAPVPFMWVLPLSLYLLSFIICFERDEWYARVVFLPLLAAALALLAYTTSEGVQNHTRLKALTLICCSGLFVCCTVCHGELAKLKPHPRYLTLYYLVIAAGGALGGAFVGLAAPHLFRVYLELPIGMVACGLLAVAAMLWDRSFLTSRWVRLAFLAQQGVFIACLAVYLNVEAQKPIRGARLTARNFYGALRVVDYGLRDEKTAYRALIHGTINHGEQYLSAERRRRPLTYYTLPSGVGRAIREGQSRPRQRVGMVGLGAGTLAAYGRPGDDYRFYEINPLVVKIARTDFTYLQDCPAKTTVVLGDARLSLEREPPGEFDLLVMDAFSSDAIPAHLITREALELYFRHLKPGGVLAVNVSNRYLALQPVLKRGAEALGKDARVVDTSDGEGEAFGGTWALITARRALFESPLLKGATKPLADRPGVTLWTDDNSNLLRILK